MLDNISHVARVTICCAIFLQLISMRTNKSARVNTFAFFLFSMGALMSSYGYYIEDDNKLEFRTSIKLLNSIMLLLIALMACNYRK